MFDIEFNNLSLNATDYEWNFGDGNFSTDFEPVYTYSVNGPQSMWLVASNDCGNDTAFLDLMSVGIEEKEVLTSMSLYPNPTTGIVNVTLEALSVSNQDVLITLFDATGKTMIELDHSFQLGTNSLVLDLSKFADGAYFLSVSDQDSNIVRTVFLNR